jgi:DNA polymerase-3 subunit chi
MALRFTETPTFIVTPRQTGIIVPYRSDCASATAGALAETHIRAKGPRMQVDFYHLTMAPLDRVLPSIAEKVVGSGGRLLIVAEDAALRTRIDQLLWSYSAASFLPHAQAGGDWDADQPALIADAVAPANGARNIALVDGLWRDEALAFDRAFHMFDEESIGAARVAWRTLGERDGVERRYWRQDENGRWAQVA